MVPAGVGDDAPRDFFRRELQDLVGRAAQLEAPDRLQAFRLQPDLAPGTSGKYARTSGVFTATPAMRSAAARIASRETRESVSNTHRLILLPHLSVRLHLFEFYSTREILARSARLVRLGDVMTARKEETFRPLTDEELAFFRRLFDVGHDDLRSFEPQLKVMRARRSCSCGCPSIKLEVPEGTTLGQDRTERIVGDFAGETSAGNPVGVLVFQERW